MRALQGRPAWLERQEIEPIDAEYFFWCAPLGFMRGDGAGFLVSNAEDRLLISPLHPKKPRLRGGVAGKIGIAIKVIRSDIQQRRNFAFKAECQVQLIAGKLQHIDTARIKRPLPQDRQADITAHLGW